MKRTNQTFSALVLAGMMAMGSLGAGDAKSQPATAPGAAATTSAPSNDAGAQSNRQGRRNHGGGGGGGRTDAGASNSASASGTGSISLDKYAILKTRSIFVKGNQTIAGENSGPRPSFSRTNDVVGKRSSMLVFNGVIVMSDEPNAMIEDQGSNTVTLLRLGDPIAAGRLSSITFDDITYEENGNEKKVMLGQNLDGVTPTAMVAAPTSPSSTQPGAAPMTADGTTAAPTGVAPATPGGSSADDILAKMKAKRAAELGNK